MYVIKRDGRHEPVAFDKITERVRNLACDLRHVDAVLIAQKVVAGVFPGVKTSQLDELAAETAAALATTHPQYHQLAGRIAVTNLHKCTSPRFSHVMVDLLSTILNEPFLDFVRAHADALDAIPDHERDLHAFDYFGFRTLERSYLLHDVHTHEIVERPQHLWLRVAVAVNIHARDEDEDVMQRVRETYRLISQGAYTHATPTLFNSGLKRQQLSSCFLLQMQEDSIDGIFETLSQCARISKYAGGIGLSVHAIRASGSSIHTTQGRSNGLVPMLRVFNETARYVDQGGGKRKGAFAIYLEPWHADIFEVLLLKKNQGSEHERARDLFYALWTPDLFMRRVEQDGVWTLFDPATAPGLHEVHSAAFDTLYERYEREGRGVRTVQASVLWRAILTSQEETGSPYMLFKDACNIKSNHQHLGTIQCSNLCTEVVEYTSRDEIAVCNLASVSLPHFVIDAFDQAWSPCAGGSVSAAWRCELTRADAEEINWNECEVPVTVECVARRPASNESIAPPDGAIHRFSAPSHASVQATLAALGFSSDLACDGIIDTQPPDFARIKVSVQDDDALHGAVNVTMRRIAGDAFTCARVYACVQAVANGSLSVDDARVTSSVAAPCNALSVDRTQHDADIASIYYIDDRALVFSTRPFPLRLTRPRFDLHKLHRVTQTVAHNLDRVIDANFYPLPEAQRSNRRHRPIGIGVQGFADVLARMMLAFESPEAQTLNRAIFETMYHAAATASVARARRLGAYETFAGSPSSRGQLQYHLWDKRPTETVDRWDWRGLERDVLQHGLRNSLLIAPMPTATTAQILGNNESFEPYMSNVFTRRVLAGEFTVVNKHLVDVLVRRRLWSTELRDRLIATKGSVQPLRELPDDVRAVFKTVWEIPHKIIMNQAIARGPFVCQSQSLNAHMADVTVQKLTSLHFYAWRNGLKTGLYYLRTRPRADAIAFTVDPDLERNLRRTNDTSETCTTCSA